jgi:sortase (surface protein transpeptidase)
LIVCAHDLAVLRSHHREQLVLQACHPRFFATHRYLAYARLVRVEPRDGQPYSIGSGGPLT